MDTWKNYVVNLGTEGDGITISRRIKRDWESPNAFVKANERRKRKIFNELLHIKSSKIFLYIMLLLIMCSWLLADSTSKQVVWVSSLLQSLATGILAGWVMYVLSNLRNQKAQETNRVLEQLYNVSKYGKNIYNINLNYSCYKLFEHKVYALFDCENDGSLLIESAYEYIEALKNLDYDIYWEMYDELCIDIDEMEGDVKEICNFENIEFSFETVNELSANLYKVIGESYRYIEKKIKYLNEQKWYYDNKPF